MRLSVSVKGWSTPTPAAAPDRPDAAGSHPAASRGGLAPSRSPREGGALRPSPAGTPTPPKTAAGCNPAAKNAGTLPGYHGRRLAPPVAPPRGARAPPPWPAPLQSARPRSGALRPRRRSGDPNPAKIRSSGLAISSPFPVPGGTARATSGWAAIPVSPPAFPRTPFRTPFQKEPSRGTASRPPLADDRGHQDGDDIGFAGPGMEPPTPRPLWDRLGRRPFGVDRPAEDRALIEPPVATPPDRGGASPTPSAAFRRVLLVSRWKLRARMNAPRARWAHFAGPPLAAARGVTPPVAVSHILLVPRGELRAQIHAPRDRLSHLGRPPVGNRPPSTPRACA